MTTANRSATRIGVGIPKEARHEEVTTTAEGAPPTAVLPPSELPPPYRESEGAGQGIPPVAPANIAPKPERPDEWRDTPWLEGQFRRKVGVKISGTKTRIFNLSVANELSDYSTLMEKVRPNDPGVIVHQNTVERSQRTDAWLVFLQYSEVSYKNVVLPRPDPEKN